MLKKDLLKDTHALRIVTELSNIQITDIRDSGNRLVADHLAKIRDAIWGEVSIVGGQVFDKEPKSKEQIQKVFEEELNGLDDKQKELLIESYAKMGHLYEIATISARSNYFKDIKNDPRDRAVAFGGIEEFIYNDEQNELDAAKKGNTKKAITLDEWIEKLNQPVFEMTFTAHPTNVNGLESMKAQREICKALESGDKDSLKLAIKKYQETPLLHDGGKNLTVHDETANTLFFLGNIFDDLGKSYKQFDDTLSAKAVREKTEYDPTKLDLKTKFGAWGSSGDKDGNKNVTAETTLEAIAMHTQAAISKYNESLEKINAPELDDWKEKLANKKNLINELMPEIEALSKDAKETMTGKSTINPVVLADRFDDLSRKLVDIRVGLDEKGLKEFTGDLEKSYKETKDENTLTLLRQARTFGFTFGKIEYRETAEEYERVVGELLKSNVPNYDTLDPEDKLNKITAVLKKEGNTAAGLLRQQIGEIVKNGAGKAYSDDDAMPIAYHSIKRMELARDFPDMIKDNVLAECGQLNLKDRNGKPVEPTEQQAAAQGVSNLLEAQFLQCAVQQGEKRAKLGVVPLFEEPDTMKHIDKIMGTAYENDAYKDQLAVIQAERGKDHLVQQVQIAHSDNARRSGLQAARAYIHEAHKKMRELEEKSGIETEFFEGGSVSDAYRNGVRAISANVNSFGLHKFAKMTFQGGDLLNYFNHPDSTSRLFYRQMSHQASWIKKDESGKWVTQEPEKTIFELEEEKRNKTKDRTPNEVFDEVATTALKNMLHDYQKNDFTQDKIGTFLGILDYDKEVANSNSSSRAGGRGIVGEAIDAIADTAKKFLKIAAVKIDKVRTIGFSKAWQNNGIVPSWIGSKELREELEKYTKDKYLLLVQESGLRELTDDEKNFQKSVAETLNDTENKSFLNPKLINKFYNKSNTFRDAQDRAAFGLALSDMNASQKIIDNKLSRINPEDTESLDNKDKGIEYFARVKDTFEAAASLAYEAITGKDYIIDAPKGVAERNEEIGKKLITKALPNLNGEFIRKKNYGDFIMWLRSEHSDIFDNPNLARTAICAGDIVNHGRWLGASDNTYIESRRSNLPAM